MGVSAQVGPNSYVGWKRPLAGLVTMLVAVGLLLTVGPGVERAFPQEACDPGYDTTHVLVRMEADASTGALEAMKALNGAGGEYESKGLERLWIVDLPNGLTVPQAVSLYGAAEGVAYAEPDHKIYPADDPQGTCAEETVPAPIVDLTATPDPVRVGGTLTYEAKITNPGPGVAKNVGLLTGVPEGASLLSFRYANGDTTGSCPPDEAGRIRCSIGDIPANGSATYTLKVRPSEAGVLSQDAIAYASNQGITVEPVTSTRTQVLPARQTRFGACTISGTPGRDVYRGTSGRDVVCGLGGDDHLIGEGAKTS